RAGRDELRQPIAEAGRPGPGTRRDALPAGWRWLAGSDAEPRLGHLRRAREEVLGIRAQRPTAVDPRHGRRRPDRSAHPLRHPFLPSRPAGALRLVALARTLARAGPSREPCLDAEGGETAGA